MSLRTFILGLSASFRRRMACDHRGSRISRCGISRPSPSPRRRTAPPASSFPKRAGRVADGAKVYAENGCYLCHTQVVRPTYAGNDLYRPDWGGLKTDADRGDTRRETNAYDFYGEKFAQIGVMRMGPDLSNLGRRVETLYAAGA